MTARSTTLRRLADIIHGLSFLVFIEGLVLAVQRWFPRRAGLVLAAGLASMVLMALPIVWRLRRSGGDETPARSKGDLNRLIGLGVTLCGVGSVIPMRSGRDELDVIRLVFLFSWFIVMYMCLYKMKIVRTTKGPPADSLADDAL